MSPFASLLGAIQIPAWRGSRRVHRLGEPTKAGRYAKRWTPWTLIVEGVSLPTAKVAASCWPLLRGRVA